MLQRLQVLKGAVGFLDLDAWRVARDRSHSVLCLTG